jgi:putative transcriptional regulator
MEPATGSLLIAAPTMGDPNFARSIVLLLDAGESGALGVVLNRPTELEVADVLEPWADLVAGPQVLFQGGPVEIMASAVSSLRIFAGYAGWGAGQLEAEIEEGAWYVVPAEPEDPFLHEPERLWATVLRRQGGQLAMLATMPPEPGLN